MRQPTRFYLQVNCACYGCRRKFRKTIPEFQKHIKDKYGLRRSNFDLQSGSLEIIDNVAENKLEELKVVFLEFTKKKHPSNDNTTSYCCFWTSKKNEGTASHEPHLHDRLEHLTIRDNNENNFTNKFEKDRTGGINQTEANHHHHHHHYHHNQQQKQEQHSDADRKSKRIMEEGGKGNIQERKEIILGEMNRNANSKHEKDGPNSKGKGIMGEDGKGRQQGKEIKIGGTGENMNQMGQNPRYETRNESNQMGQAGQYSRGEIPVNDQNDQRGQYPRSYTETQYYGQTYHTNYMHPRSQMDPMEGGYYCRQPPPYISPFSDETTADGGCSIM